MRAWWLLLLSACAETRPREPDEFERFRNQPVPAGNFRIRLTRLEAAGRETQGLTRISTVWDSNGAAVWIATSGWLRQHSRRREEQMLLVADGHQGMMQVSEWGRAVVTRAIPVYQGTVLVRTIDTVVTGSGFAVGVAGEADGTVHLRLQPYFSGGGESGGGPIEVVELRTEVRVRPGEPILLMELDEAGETFASAFFRRSIVALTVER